MQRSRLEFELPLAEDDRRFTLSGPEALGLDRGHASLRAGLRL